MSTPQERLANLGHELSAFPARPGPLRMVVVHGGVAYVSGQPPARDGRITCFGTVGVDVSVDEARQAAELCALNALGALAAELKDLSRVERILKVTGFVSCVAGFEQQSQVINGASELLVAVFGESGCHARSAIGVSSLPANMAVEVELVAAVRQAGRETGT